MATWCPRRPQSNEPSALHDPGHFQSTQLHPHASTAATGRNDRRFPMMVAGKQSFTKQTHEQVTRHGRVQQLETSYVNGGDDSAATLSDPLNHAHDNGGRAAVQTACGLICSTIAIVESETTCGPSVFQGKTHPRTTRWGL